jgi:hypothetical protein
LEAKNRAFKKGKTFMSNFIFLFRGGRTEASTSPEAMQAQMQKWMNWIQKLRDQGKYLAGDPLEGGGKVLKSSKVITDGPFAEGKELVGGYFLIRAESLEQAAEVAKECPIFETGGSVEVRPVQVINPR